MKRPVRVVPAILAEDPEELKALMRQAEDFTDYVQVDFMDGEFVPSQNVTWEHLINLEFKLNWEAHIMILHPEGWLEGLRQAGAQKGIFHYEATPSPMEVISQARKLGFKVGLAVNPETSISTILPLSDEVDSVLFLSVHPGFYGAQFIPEVLDKISDFRSARPRREVGIDGGIKEGNIVQVARAGADVICVGSAILLQPDPAESYRHLTALAQES